MNETIINFIKDFWLLVIILLFLFCVGFRGIREKAIRDYFRFKKTYNKNQEIFWVIGIFLTILGVLGGGLIINTLNINLGGKMHVGDVVTNNVLGSGSFGFDSEKEIYQKTFEDLGCTYEITGTNIFSYSCNFHPFRFVTHEEVEKLLFNLPNGQKIFVEKFPKQIPLNLALCKDDYSSCMIFEEYIYSEDEVPCFSYTFDKWEDAQNIVLKKEFC